MLKCRWTQLSSFDEKNSWKVFHPFLCNITCIQCILYIVITHFVVRKLAISRTLHRHGKRHTNSKSHVWQFRSGSKTAMRICKKKNTWVLTVSWMCKRCACSSIWNFDHVSQYTILLLQSQWRLPYSVWSNVKTAHYLVNVTSHHK